MKPGDIVWISLRLTDSSQGPALTIGAKLSESGTFITYAGCSPKDLFCRKKAQNIIEGRLLDTDKGMRRGKNVWFLPSAQPITKEFRAEVLNRALDFVLKKMEAKEFRLGWMTSSILASLLDRMHRSKAAEQ